MAIQKGFQINKLQKQIHFCTLNTSNKKINLATIIFLYFVSAVN